MEMKQPGPGCRHRSTERPDRSSGPPRSGYNRCFPRPYGMTEWLWAATRERIVMHALLIFCSFRMHPRARSRGDAVEILTGDH